MRYFLEISYDGTAYHGWQVQNNASTVQQTLNEALSTILRCEISTIGSGRTDAGVHALNQVVHFDLSDEVNTDELCHKLNRLLPRDIAALELRVVTDEASARFAAISRSYLYRIHQHKNPFLELRSYHHYRSLDIDLMNASCEIIKNWTDFESLSKVQTDVNHFNCQIFDARWERYNDEIHFHVSANRFLRGMIRAMVGTMLLVGEGNINLDTFEEILASRDRTKAGRSVPAHGLYLKDIIYPEDIYI
ncbi:tRNA pseudouridine(38-40) synthase TruA [Reichenbachiella sp. MSK19-1]|uniref:tRNA pseudouridine(38-40) synthase TruA n=1 Tax=Reichenbachiella sp. MSK19-1 TaxID=1897631 RepID=UPI000E6BE17C|nr:tRNA pseudouridine(38-40) synthase TruA [Reichenbachiella sp. MSK19-1]RJE71853.1 tRNA pseudouridine(38-40) synthase TruA [Reichenbachiella sp. MSK19-1]